MKHKQNSSTNKKDTTDRIGVFKLSKFGQQQQTNDQSTRSRLQPIACALRGRVWHGGGVSPLRLMRCDDSMVRNTENVNKAQFQSEKTIVPRGRADHHNRDVPRRSRVWISWMNVDRVQSQWCVRAHGSRALLTACRTPSTEGDVVLGFKHATRANICCPLDIIHSVNAFRDLFSLRILINSSSSYSKIELIDCGLSLFKALEGCLFLFASPSSIHLERRVHVLSIDFIWKRPFLNKIN